MFISTLLIKYAQIVNIYITWSERLHKHSWLLQNGSSCEEGHYKTALLKIFAKSEGKHLYRRLF